MIIIEVNFRKRFMVLDCYCKQQYGVNSKYMKFAESLGMHSTIFVPIPHRSVVFAPQLKTSHFTVQLHLLFVQRFLVLRTISLFLF